MIRSINTTEILPPLEDLYYYFTYKKEIDAPDCKFPAHFVIFEKTLGVSSVQVIKFKQLRS